MIPDLVYFLPLGVSGAQSHSVHGLLWFCLPAGVMGWVAYQGLVPTAVARRVRPGRPIDWSPSALLPVAVSVLVAAATHVAWDSFTHTTGFAVQALPALRQPVHLADWYQPSVFTLLQHGSTLGGLSALAFWGVRWFRSASARQQAGATRLPTWARAFIIVVFILSSSVAGFLVLWAGSSAGEGTFGTLQKNMGRAIFSAGTVFLTLFMLTALTWRVRQYRFVEGRGCPTRG
jgi:hypothetical protein